MPEVWLPIPGYEGLYEVSDRGRIRALDRMVKTKRGPRRFPGRILSSTPVPRGYVLVGLSKNGRSRTRPIHRHVLEAFVGPCPSGMQCCHANDNKQDNRLSNLRWDTSSANTIDNVRNGNHNNARKTACSRGHQFADDNVYISPSRGTRTCRKCRYISQRRWELQNRKKGGAHGHTARTAGHEGILLRRGTQHR